MDFVASGSNVNELNGRQNRQVQGLSEHSNRLRSVRFES